MASFLTICFINNYNNERFLAECLNSVFVQTTPFNKVIVVDDGSTDSSMSILKQYQDTYPQLEVLEKENGGQLSVFNFVAQAIPENYFYWTATMLTPQTIWSWCWQNLKISLGILPFVSTEIFMVQMMRL